MDKEKREELISGFLSIMELSSVIKEIIGDYEKQLTFLLKDPILIDNVKANIIFDVLQSIEGLNSSQYSLHQKLLLLISKIDIDKIKEEKSINKEEKSINKENKIEEKKDPPKENKLIKNVLEYLNERLNDIEKDEE